MNFIHSDLGHQEAGKIVEITLSGNAANVQLLDSSNFYNYEKGNRYRYYGGLATKSPVKLVVPHSSHWHVAIDMRGLRGSVRASVTVLNKPEPLPKMKNSISPLADLVNIDQAESASYDVFISHASEDKEEVARPLVDALRERGLNVWYDDLTLRIGDSLRRKIDTGIYNSLFSVVILSKAFIQKSWTNYEFDGIISCSNSIKQRVLPIWHNISKDEVLRFCPSIADKVARNTASNTIDEIADEIAQAIHGFQNEN